MDQCQPNAQRQSHRKHGDRMELPWLCRWVCLLESRVPSRTIPDPGSLIPDPGFLAVLQRRRSSLAGGIEERRRHDSGPDELPRSFDGDFELDPGARAEMGRVDRGKGYQALERR